MSANTGRNATNSTGRKWSGLESVIYTKRTGLMEKTGSSTIETGTELVTIDEAYCVYEDGVRVPVYTFSDSYYRGIDSIIRVLDSFEWEV